MVERRNMVDMIPHHFRVLAFILVFVGALLSSGKGEAAIVPLHVYNDTGSPNFTGEIDITVDEVGDMAFFTFDNTSPSGNTSITRVWFEIGLGSVLSNGIISAETSGVDFEPATDGGGGPNPPAKNDVPTHPWSSTFERFFAEPPPSDNGVNPAGELLTIKFDYAGTLAALILSLTDPSGTSRIAVQTQTCPSSSNSCEAATTVVPLPAGILLLVSAIFCTMGLGYIRNRT